jgi:hypothetical protein
MDERAEERAELRRLWAATLPLSAPLAVGGRTFLQGHGIPAEVAAAARVRFAHLWGDADDHQGAAVVFPLQDADGKLVAAETWLNVDIGSFTTSGWYHFSISQVNALPFGDLIDYYGAGKPTHVKPGPDSSANFSAEFDFYVGTYARR